jgi:hypothetical protein
MIANAFAQCQFFRLKIKAFVDFWRPRPVSWPPVVRRFGVLVLLGLAVWTAAAEPAEPRAALERFLARAAGTALRDLTIDQDLAVYNPDGRAVFASGTQRVIVRFPDQQRIEQTVEGRTEVRLTVRGKTWRRGSDGKVAEVPHDRAQPIALAVPLRRSADEVLAEWRMLGIRDDRSHEARMAGRVVTVIGAQAGERDRPAAWLDPEFGVMRFVAREAADPGPVLTDLLFSDHRPLAGGLFFPYRQETFRSGKLLMRVLVRALAVNTIPADTLFDPTALASR